MKKLKYIKKLGAKSVYPYENPPIGKVELWDFSRANENDEARKEAVCLVASISYGNGFCKDPERLWNLLIEKGHESPFEFVREPEFELKQNLRNTDFMTDSSFSVYVYGRETKRIKEDRLERRRRRVATFKLKVPIFVARQIQRHRAFSYMEMSRRYVKGEKVKFEFWKPKDFSEPLLAFHGIAPHLDEEDQCDLFEHSEALYEYLLEETFTRPEQARAFLPLGLYTQFWMQGDYKAWLNFFIHRLHPEAQEETRLVAQSMWELLKEHQPEIIETMADYLKKWIRDCNPMFRVAREKKAEWFRENFLGGEQ